MHRRHFLTNGLAAMAGAALPDFGRLAAQAPSPLFDPIGPIVPIRALVDRMFRITVCLRPFRAQGPRLDVEQVGRKLVVHNYGHGGSGWSLSWGSADIAVRKALASSPRDIAILGAGAIGLTSAITAQRAGARVTIYARDRFPDVPSARATGSWTPDSRVAMADTVGRDFATLWSGMAHSSFARWQSYVGLPGRPVAWNDRYTLSDLPPDEMRAQLRSHNVAGFANFSDLIGDISPRSQVFGPGTHPFATRYALRNSQMTFNIASLAHLLMQDFLAAGGRIEAMNFEQPSDIGRLREKVVINCTGYGARALFRDETVHPVRGQIAWLLPQPGVDYGLFYRNVSVVGRSDGIVVQDLGPDDRFGFDDADERPDRGAAEASVRRIAELFDGTRR